MDAEDKELTSQTTAEEPDVILDRLFDGDKLVFNWDKCAFVILILWCLQPVLTIAAQIYHPVAGAAISTISFYLLGICACIICILYLLDRINYEKGGFFLRIWKHQRWNVFFLAMLVWGGIAALLANKINIAMMGTTRLDGYLSYVIYAGFFGCGLILSDKNKLMKVFKSFTGVSVILGITSLAAIIPFIRSSPNIYIISFWFMRGTSIFSNINHYGYYLVMAIICAMGLFIYEKNRIKSIAWLAVALFNIWVLIDSTSFGPYIAVFAGLIVIVIIGKFKIKSFIPVISLVLLSLCLMPVYNIIDNFSYRNSDFLDDEMVQNPSAKDNDLLSVWRQTEKMILKKPVFGYGPEGLIGKYTEKVTDESGEEHTYTSYMDRPYNEYLQHAAFMGLPALIFYLAALITLLTNRIKNIKNVSVSVMIAFCAVIGYLISAFFGNTMYYTTPFFFMLLGITANISHNKPDVTDTTKN